MKILYCINTIGVIGGTERVTIVKANALADIDGIEVGICFTDRGEYPRTVHPLSPKVKIFDLGTPYWELDSLWKVATGYIRKVYDGHRALRRVIDNFRPDILVTTGGNERHFVTLTSRKVAYPTIFGDYRLRKIREFHFASTYELLEATGPASWIKARTNRMIQKHLVSRLFDKTYLLTRRDLDTNFKGCPRYDCMPNPSTYPPVDHMPDSKEHVVLAIGRISYQKNFESLIRVWSAIESQAHGWTLKILGGPDHASRELHEYARTKGCRHVECPGWSDNIPAELSKASILCMTSRFEGMPLVLLEAMNAGVAPITFDYEFGPSDIITDGVNGILVTNGDENEMSAKLLDLIKNNDMRHSIGTAAMKRIKDFSAPSIARRWIEKFNSLS